MRSPRDKRIPLRAVLAITFSPGAHHVCPAAFSENSMYVKLTPAGEEAVWTWASASAKDADALSRAGLIAQAHKQINLIEPDFDGHYRVWIGGAASASGHLHALVLRPAWYRVQPKPTSRAQNGLLVI